MRQRNIIINKLETLEARLKSLEFMVRRGSPIPEFLKTIENSTEILNDVKAMVEREEHSPSEINRR
jgi:hypothetical protein